MFLMGKGMRKRLDNMGCQLVGGQTGQTLMRFSARNLPPPSLRSKAASHWQFPSIKDEERKRKPESG